MSLPAATPRAPDLRGTALDGRYELVVVLGEGNFGRVYRGRDRRLGRSVAVKVIKPWWAEDPDWVSRFEREAQLMASVSDPRIVQIFDVGDAPEGLYYVAELVEGESLDALLRRGALIPSRARDVAEQLSRALGSAHSRRVVHGDVKPANVLIKPDGSVKVTDFGLARLLGDSSGHAAATVAGTPTYMAPEQARGGGITPAADVYSIGVMLYEMLTGRPPFGGGSPVELALRHLQDDPPPLPRSVPAALVGVVQRALAKDPEARYRNGGELADALTQARPGRGRASLPPRPASGAVDSSTKRPARTLVAPWRGPRRNVNPAARRRTIVAYALVLLLLAGMIAGALLTSAARVRVPDLRGLTRPALTAKLSRAHLRLDLRRRYSPRAAGTVIAQTPEAGARVGEGSRVLATLSAGPAPVAVPRILGFSSPDAQSALQQLGLRARLQPVPAPGVVTGTVIAQYPSRGTPLRPGSTVSVSVAEPPRWRTILSFTDRGGQASPPFRIRGERWRIVYDMGYDGTCTFIFFCSGPTANVLNLSQGTTVSSFDLNEGTDQVQAASGGPGTYELKITPGDDSATWSAQVQGYY